MGYSNSCVLYSHTASYGSEDAVNGANLGVFLLSLNL